MKLNALLIDPAVLGEEGWDYLERVCGMLPDLGVVVCTGRSTVAQRVRGPAPRRRRLDHQALPPRGGDGPDRSGLAPAPPRPVRDVEAGPLVAGELEIRADQFQAFVGERQPRPHPPRVRAAAPAGRGARARCSSARRSTSGSGATRWPTATARSTSSSASCARSWRSTRRAGATSTPTSGSATGFDPEPAGIVAGGAAARRGRGAGRSRVRRPLHRFVHNELHDGITGPRSFPPCSASMADGNREQLFAPRLRRLEIRPEEHAALVDGRPLSLTMRELQLLSPWPPTRSGS